MANTPEIQKEERRLKVREAFLARPSSNRNISKIARDLGIESATVLRDLAYLRRQARRSKKHNDLDLKAVEIYERYLYEYEQAEINIKEALIAGAWATVASLRKTKTEIIEKIAELWGLVNIKGLISVDQSNKQLVQVIVKYPEEVEQEKNVIHTDENIRINA